MLKFRLSTILLVVALAATLLSWYMDRNSRHKITGNWQVLYTVSAGNLVNVNTLEIKTDGTFTRVQADEDELKTITGEISIHDDGLVQFNATNLTIRTADGDKKDSNLDHVYYCRCAIDTSGCLIILERHFPSGPPDFEGISWGDVYTRENAR